MGIELHFIDGGVDRGPLPSYASLELSPVFCDYGSISFSYPKNGKRFSLLKGRDELEIVPWIDGVEQPQLGGLVQEISGDDVAEAAVYKYNGVGYLKLLDEGRAFPFGWPDYDPQAPSWFFSAATAGEVVLPLIAGAQGRGALPGITTSFTATHDSAGVPWAKAINIEVKPQYTITDVVKELFDKGVAEFVMYGRELRMYNLDGMGVDRTQVVPPDKPLIFRRGRDLRDSPRKVSSRDVATVLLGAGKQDSGLYIEEVNPAAVAARRRIEGYVSSGNIAEEGSLQAYVEAVLATVSQTRMEKTHGLEFGKKSPRPIKHFDVGDWAYSDVGQGTEKLRVKQWVLKVDADGTMSGSVVMNDLFAELEEKLANRLRAIESGASVVGDNTTPTPEVPPEVSDGIAPALPTGLLLNSASYVANNGETFAQITASWNAPTTNEDGSPLTDLAGYSLRWTAPYFVGYKYENVNGATAMSWSGVNPGAEVSVEVAAYDRYGNVSDWTPAEIIEAASDSSAPDAPSQPIVTNWLGLLRIRWDGETALGLAMPSDFNHVEIHVSPVNDFVPSELTYVGSLQTAGAFFYDVPYGTNRNVKFIAVDNSGNESPASAQASGSTTQVVSDDILDGAVGTAKLADLAVTNAKIGLLAVNDANVGNLSVGKLIAGTLSADVLLGGRIATALTGARAEMNASGFYMFDENNIARVIIDGTQALLTGVYRTADTGRRVEIGVLRTGFTSLSSILFHGDSITDPISYIEGFNGSGFVQFMYGIRTAENQAASGLWDSVYMDSQRLMYLSTDQIQINIRKDSFLGGFRIYDSPNRLSGGSDPSAKTLFSVDSSGVTFTPPGGNTGSTRTRIFGTDNPYASPATGYFNEAGYGVTQFFFYNPGAGSNAALELKSSDFSSFQVHRAALYETSSDEVHKADIREAEYDFLSMVLGVSPKRYRRKFGRHDDLEVLGEEEIGMIAQEVPEAIRGSRASDGTLTINNSAVDSVLWGAVRQLAQIVLEGKGKGK